VLVVVDAGVRIRGEREPRRRLVEPGLPRRRIDADRRDEDVAVDGVAQQFAGRAVFLGEGYNDFRVVAGGP